MIKDSLSFVIFKEKGLVILSLSRCVLKAVGIFFYFL